LDLFCKIGKSCLIREQRIITFFFVKNNLPGGKLKGSRAAGGAAAPLTDGTVVMTAGSSSGTPLVP
jgi:hypothetical protein